jgi:predicted RNA-binding Zn ribbon-like protein
MRLNRTAVRFHFLGGDLALDFVNTVAYRGNPGKRHDYLSSMDDVFRWVNESGLISIRDGGKGEHDGKLRRLLKLRANLYEVFLNISLGLKPSPQDLEWFAALATKCQTHKRLVWTNRGARWEWEKLPGTDLVYWNVADAAARLFSSDECGHIRVCSDDECGWLFLDKSQGGRRRWCSMQDCGNRAKARRHYLRTTSVRSQGSRRG